MKLTQQHLAYYRSKRVNPKWAKDIPKPLMTVSVHSLINIQAGIRLNDTELCVSNTLVILRTARKRGGERLRESLTQMAQQPGTLINAEKRRAFCRKWLLKLNSSTI